MSKTKNKKATLLNGNAIKTAILIRKNKASEFYWLSIGKTGEEIAKSSESYKTLANVKKGIKSEVKTIFNCCGLNGFVPMAINGIDAILDYKGAKKSIVHIAI